MAKKEEKPKSGEGKKPRKHLHQIITTAAHDGTYTHHHVYKAHKDDHFEEPARLMGTSTDPEEAGDHVGEQFAANQGAQAQPEGPDQGEGAETAPQEQGGAPDGEAEA